jgi:large subunit ribosomal protein L25
MKEFHTMAALTLSARPRTTLGKAVKRLRWQGITPANIYGHNVASTAIEANEKELNLLLRRAGRTTLIQVQIEGEPAPRSVLVKDYTRRATNDQLLHVDFFEVSMRETLHVTVPVVLTGVAPVVARGEGVLVQALETVSVECLPSDIPSQIEVDLAPLTDANVSLFVRDLRAPAGVTILTDGDVPVASVTAASEEVEPEREAAAEEESEAAPEA